MIRTLTRDTALINRIALIGLFVALTAISAQVKFYLNSPVPYTLQVLVVLLAGMVLGARDGALSQIAFIGLIALGAPIAANGSAALSGATAGFLFGFIPAAYVTGYLAERVQHNGGRLLAGLAGVAVIYTFGLVMLKLTLNVSWGQAWAWSVAPFIAIDLVKALIAAGMMESGRALIKRYFDH
jgi:biotin transport system substrate-specific component